MMRPSGKPNRLMTVGLSGLERRHKNFTNISPDRLVQLHRNRSKVCEPGVRSQHARRVRSQERTESNVAPAPFELLPDHAEE